MRFQEGFHDLICPLHFYLKYLLSSAAINELNERKEMTCDGVRKEVEGSRIQINKLNKIIFASRKVALTHAHTHTHKYTQIHISTQMHAQIYKRQREAKILNCYTSRKYGSDERTC